MEKLFNMADKSSSQYVITVIIPSFKPQDYLWECLDSLRNQTLPTTDFQILLVLNGCCEPYKSDIEEYVHRTGMTNLTLIQIDEGGVSNARNMGISMARSQYLTFIDDDDYVSSTYLASLLQVAREGVTPVSNVVAFDDYTRRVLPNYLTNRFHKIVGRGPVSLFRAKSYMSVPVAKLLHRDIVDGYSFNPDFKIGEDALFMFEVSRSMKRIQATDQNAVYYRRVRNNSASMCKRTKRERLSMVVSSILAYTRVFVLGFPHYNLPLYLSRVSARFWQLSKLLCL